MLLSLFYTVTENEILVVILLNLYFYFDRRNFSFGILVAQNSSSPLTLLFGIGKKCGCVLFAQVL